MYRLILLIILNILSKTTELKKDFIIKAMLELLSV